MVEFYDRIVDVVKPTKQAYESFQGRVFEGINQNDDRTDKEQQTENESYQGMHLTRDTCDKYSGF